MPAVPVTRRRIVALLKKHGPMTAHQINTFMPKTNSDTLKSSIRYSLSAPPEKRAFHVSGHVRAWGSSGKPSPILTVGPGENAAPPEALPRSLVNHRYEVNHAAQRRAERQRKNDLKKRAATWLTGLI